VAPPSPASIAPPPLLLVELAPLEPPDDALLLASSSPDCPTTGPSPTAEIPHAAAIATMTTVAAMTRPREGTSTMVTRYAPTSMACVFCSILERDGPANAVIDDDVCLAFLDTKPLFFGHVLVVPRKHVVTLPELAPDQIGPLFARVQLLAAAVPAAMEAEGSFVAMNNVVSQSVPHLHVHVVPRRKGDGLKGFFWPRTKYRDDAHATEIAARIRERLSGPGASRA
jgi:histidine triad (HIT) family protein